MDILNLSYGQYSLNPSLEDATALAGATKAGVMAVAAAGNDGLQAGLFTTIYPSYDADVLSVAMLGNTLTMGALLNFSSSIPIGMNGETASQLGEPSAARCCCCMLLPLLQPSIVNHTTAVIYACLMWLRASCSELEV
jgi:subtilisin family serine protease